MPLTTLGQETRLAYSTPPPSPHGAFFPRQPGINEARDDGVLGCSGISWAICKSAPRSRQITTPAPHHSVFYRSDTLPVAQRTASKHWRNQLWLLNNSKLEKCSIVLSAKNNLNQMYVEVRARQRDICRATVYTTITTPV